MYTQEMILDAAEAFRRRFAEASQASLDLYDEEIPFPESRTILEAEGFRFEKVWGRTPNPRGGLCAVFYRASLSR